VLFDRITCQVTEDWGNDEIYLKFNGFDNLYEGTRSINEGESEYNLNFSYFSGQATVDLYEEDWPDSDDWLGQITINEWDKGGHHQSFAQDGAHYTLYYNVF
jgi:hypothetical protein